MRCLHCTRASHQKMGHDDSYTTELLLSLLPGLLVVLLPPAARVDFLDCSNVIKVFPKSDCAVLSLLTTTGSGNTCKALIFVGVIPNNICCPAASINTIRSRVPNGIDDKIFNWLLFVKPPAPK